MDPWGLNGYGITKSANVTAEVVQKALKGNTLETVQGTVFLPAIQRYVDRLLKGNVAPLIKIDGNVIVEGNHGYGLYKVGSVILI
ncbi:hypothetical protein [Mixta hanseatica]|uniref:hypothetical protein n=1 Tax=Mixta hanseatica TaxID=2872648 RepID=UPI00201D94BE|nr:hypothetical protein [Mixta hanseatica]